MKIEGVSSQHGSMARHGPQSSSSLSSSKASSQPDAASPTQYSRFQSRVSVDQYLFETCPSDHLTPNSSYTDVTCEDTTKTFTSDTASKSKQESKSKSTLDRSRSYSYTDDKSFKTATDTERTDRLQLTRIDALDLERYTTFEYAELLWTTEEESQDGSGGCHGRVGTARLNCWMEQVEESNRMAGKEETKTDRRRLWMEAVGFLGRRQAADESASLLMQGREDMRPVQRSCVSDKARVKKGNKLFRAKRRVANLFRRVERPVESVIAAERFEIA